MSLHLVTGYAGEAHITAEDDGSLNTNIFGTANYVLNRGRQFEAQVVSNNQIRIFDGDLLLQGRFIRLTENTYEDITIDNGSQDLNRNDLICARYTKNNDTGVESASLVIIKGTAASGTPEDPEYNDTDILEDHSLVSDFPLYRITLNGLVVSDPVALFNTAPNMAGFQQEVRDQLNSLSVTQIYTATITTNWSGSEAPYTQIINVNGVLSTDKMIVDVNPASDFSLAQEQIESFASIYRIVPGANSITVYATEAINKNIPIKILCVRK